jgi:hypothetical protein
MDKSRRKSKEWWVEREGEGFLQRSQSRKARIEATSTASKNRKRRWQKGVFLREDDGYGGADEEAQW